MGGVTRSAVVVAVIVCGLVFVGPVHADFVPPTDGKLTEKQLTTYLAVLKEQMDTLRAAGSASEGTTSTAAGMAIYSDASAKMDASLAAHGMARDEYDWVGNQVSILWPIAVLRQQWEDKGKPEIEQQMKSRQDDLQAANSRLATYQKAEKDGMRVLSKHQHDAATQSTSGELILARQTVVDATANVKQIGDEVTQHDKDVADDEALAKAPPGDVSADDRSAYIDARKNDAQTAKDAATDARTRLAEARKSLDDAKAVLIAVRGKLDHPEVPVTDDEKTQVKQENDQAIADAKTTIGADQQAIQTLQETLAAGPPNIGQKVDADNLALVQKHVKEYLAAMGNSKTLDSK